MKFLLFFLGISFFFLFFLFSGVEIQDAFFDNIFLQAQIYMALSAMFVLRVFMLGTKPGNINESDHADSTHKKKWFSRYSFSRADFTEYVKVFFGEYIYYIGTLLFYISLFLILKALLGEIDIPIIFLCFNILVSTLYFYQNKFPLFQDFIRINTLVVSLFYLIKNLEYLLGSGAGIDFIYVLNLVFVFVLFYFFVRSSKGKSYLPAFCSYVFIFTVLQLIVIYKSIFGDILTGVTLLSFFVGVSSLFLTEKIASTLSITRGQVRIWGLLSLYTFVSFSPLYLFGENISSLVFLVFCGGVSSILFLFHIRFQNYISLFFSSYSLSLGALGIYGLFVPQNLELQYIFICFFLLSGLFLMGDKLSEIEHPYDKYFFRVFSIVVNVVGVICFLYFIEVSILKFAFLLFGECLYFFYSYYSLRSSTH